MYAWWRARQTCRRKRRERLEMEQGDGHRMQYQHVYVACEHIRSDPIEISKMRDREARQGLTVVLVTVRLKAVEVGITNNGGNNAHYASFANNSITECYFC